MASFGRRGLATEGKTNMPPTTAVWSKPVIVIIGLIILAIWWVQPSEWTAKVARDTALSCMRTYPTESQVSACIVLERNKYAH
jgi:hypothetical protein